MNTKFLTLFAAILIYYTVAPDIDKENAKLIHDIQLVEHKILSEKNIDDLAVKTSELVRNDRIIDAKNRKLFIDSNLPDALAFAFLQQTIGDDANRSQIEVTNLSWGEPSTKDDSPYTLLPITVAFKGSPKNCSDFFNRLQHHGKLLYIENLSIVQYMDSLSIVADLYAYRINKDMKIKGEKK